MTVSKSVASSSILAYCFAETWPCLAISTSLLTRYSYGVYGHGSLRTQHARMSGRSSLDRAVRTKYTHPASDQASTSIQQVPPTSSKTFLHGVIPTRLMQSSSSSISRSLVRGVRLDRASFLSSHPQAPCTMRSLDCTCPLTCTPLVYLS